MKKILLFTMLFSGLINLYAEGFLPYKLNGFEQPQWSFQFAFENDSYFGFGGAEEFDDFRTHGFWIWGNGPLGIYFNTTYDMFTHRGAENPSQASSIFKRSSLDHTAPSRYDQILVKIGKEFNIYNTGYMNFSVSTDISMDIVGNLGGFVLQDFYHKGIGQDRPIPEEKDYIKNEFSVIFAGEATLDFNPRIPFKTSLRTEIDTMGQLAFKVSAGVNILKKESLVFLDLSYSASTHYNQQPTVSLVERYEQGLNIHYGLFFPHIFITREINIASSKWDFDGYNNSTGTIGFRFGTEPFNGPSRRDNIGIEVSMPVMSSYETLIVWQPEFLWKLYEPLFSHLEGYAALCNGWEERDENRIDPDIHFNEFSFGLRTSLFKPVKKWIPNLRLSTGFTIRRAGFYHFDEYRAISDCNEYSFQGDLRIGLYIPVIGFKHKKGSEEHQFFIGYRLQGDFSDFGHPPQYYGRQDFDFKHSLTLGFLVYDKNMTGNKLF